MNKKILNVTNHYGNANQNNSEISCHEHVKLAIIKNIKNSKC